MYGPSAGVKTAKIYFRHQLLLGNNLIIKAINGLELEDFPPFKPGRRFIIGRKGICVFSNNLCLHPQIPPKLNFPPGAN